MDQDLRKLITERADAQGKTGIQVGGTGWLDEITVGVGEKAAVYRLKPLAEVYGEGTGSSTLDPRDEVVLPLLYAIESQIVRFDAEQRGRLTDGAAGMALNKLAMSPEGEVGSDVLANRIQIGLRLCLSLNNYSRQDVRWAIRRIAKSVENHSRKGGPRGYLDFARRMVRI